MKTIGICGFVFIALLAGSCSLGPPTVNSTGIWFGEYTGSSADDTGKLVLKLLQSEDGTVTGMMCFRQAPIGSDDLSVSIHGEVHGAKGRVTIDNDSRKYVDFGIAGTTVTGTMDIDGVKGSLTCEYMTTKIITAQKKFDSPLAHASSAKFAFDGTQYWFTNGYSDDGTITDQTGAIAKQFKFINAGDGIGALLWDGSAILCAREHAIDIVDSDGNQTSFVSNGCPIKMNGLAKLPDGYWMTRPANTSGDSESVDFIDQSGVPASAAGKSIPLPIPPNGLAFNGTDLYILGGGGDMFGNVILKADIASRKVVGAYVIEPESDSQYDLSDICFSGVTLMGIRGNQAEILELDGL